jgi:hypothetical protein
VVEVEQDVFGAAGVAEDLAAGDGGGEFVGGLGGDEAGAEDGEGLDFGGGGALGEAADHVFGFGEFGH